MKDHSPDRDIANIHPGDVLHYRRAWWAWEITDWKTWEQATRDYNGGGNPHYLQEVQAAYDRLKAARQVNQPEQCRK